MATVVEAIGPIDGREGPAPRQWLTSPPGTSLLPAIGGGGWKDAAGGHEDVHKQRTRVLWLIKGLGIGGAERLLVQTAQLVDQSRFVFSVAYLLSHKDQLRLPLMELGVTASCLDARHELDLRWAPRLRSLITRERFDIVHAHSPYVASVARITLRTLPAMHRPALVYTEHSSWASHSRWTRVANRSTAWIDDARFAVSRDVHDSMPRTIRRVTDVMSPGIPVGEFERPRYSRLATRRALGIDDDEFLVLTIANFREPKGYPDLLQAARLVLDSERANMRPSLRFVAVGQGPLEVDVAAQHRRLQLDRSFLLVGQRTDVVDMLQAADLFVLASHYEGLPLAVLEAMAAGLPLVATAVGGIPEVVRDGKEGCLVPPRRPDLLAAAILQLSTDPHTRTRFAAAARRRIVDFDLERGVERLQQRYVQLVQD